MVQDADRKFWWLYLIISYWNDLLNVHAVYIVKIGFSVSKLGTTASFLKTGCPKLDLFLRGGLLRKGITQIYGESGTGKTQLALQFSLNAQIPTKCPNDLGGRI